jgi:hypothetical protein
MTLPTLQTLVSLDHLHCHREGDGLLSDDEPYLWTAFFKVDGDTVVLDLIGDRPDDELTVSDLYLRGTCTFVTTPGNHGNLGDSDVEAGDDVGIPSAVGESGFTLKPIPVTDRANKKIVEVFKSEAPAVVDIVGGGATVGVVVVLNEEWGTPAEAAEAGHVTFNRTLEDGINAFLFQDGGSMRKEDLKNKLGYDKQTLTPEDKAALKQGVVAAARAAIKEKDRVHLPDHNVNAQEFLFDLAGLKNKGVQEIDHRLQLLVPAPSPTSSPGGGAGGLPIGSPNSPTEVLAADYELFGDILAIESSPLHVPVLHDGRLAHTLRPEVGSWAGWGDVFTGGGTGELPNITQIAAAGTASGLHVLALHDGRLAHTLRPEVGSWAGWGDVFTGGGTGELPNITQIAAGG